MFLVGFVLEFLGFSLFFFGGGEIVRFISLLIL